MMIIIKLPSSVICRSSTFTTFGWSKLVIAVYSFMLRATFFVTFTALNRVLSTMLCPKYTTPFPPLPSS